MNRKTKVVLLMLFSFLWASCWHKNGVMESTSSTGIQAQEEITIIPPSISVKTPADPETQIFRIDDYLQLVYPSEFHLTSADEEDESLDIYFLNLPESSSFIEIRSYTYDSASASTKFSNSINDQFQEYLSGEIEGTNFVPGSWQSTVVIVCDNPVPFYEYQVYLNSMKENAGTKISNYFSIDRHAFSIELQLHPDEKKIHEELREDYWNIINSIECPIPEE